MKKQVKLTLLLAGMFLAASTGVAQEYAFKVMVNKGKNEVKSGETWQQVKVGSSLKSTDELKVSENAYLGLVHANGRPLELKQAGKYKIAELAQQVGNKSSVLNKYTDFVISSNTAKKNNLAATGAVHRGNDIEVYLPTAEKAYALEPNVSVAWNAEGTEAPYTIVITNTFGDELQKVVSQEPVLKINLTDKAFAAEENLVIVVSAKGGIKRKSNDYVLKPITKTEKAKIETQYKEVQAQLGAPSALNQLILAGFFEQSGLLVDASNAYQEAIRLAPDVQDFKDDYHNFLVRHNMKSEPKK